MSRTVGSGLELIRWGERVAQVPIIKRFMTYIVLRRPIGKTRSYERAPTSLTSDAGMGNTALHMACANNFIEVARLLLEHKADINMLNKHEIQALMKMINTAMMSSNESEALDYPAFV